MPPKETGTKTLASVRRTLKIIQALDELEEASIGEIASLLGYSSSSIHEHLNTLHDEGYVVKGTNGYSLSLEFVALAASLRSQKDRQNIEYYVDRLSAEIGMIVTYVVEESGEGIFLYRNSGGQRIETAEIGTRVDLHATAAGKAILAHLPDDRVMEIIENRGLPSYTEQTISETDVLLDNLASIRDRGYAINHGERINRLRSIATDIKDETGDVTGALAISGPHHQVATDEAIEKLSSQLLSIAEEVELDSVYSGSV